MTSSDGLEVVDPLLPIRQTCAEQACFLADNEQFRDLELGICLQRNSEQIDLIMRANHTIRFKISEVDVSTRSVSA